MSQRQISTQRVMVFANCGFCLNINLHVSLHGRLSHGRSWQSFSCCMESHTVTAGEEELFSALDAIAHAPVALPVWTEKPRHNNLPQAKAKLGIYAKRRLRAAQKAAKKAFLELPYCGDWDDQGVWEAFLDPPYCIQLDDQDVKEAFFELPYCILLDDLGN